MQQQLVLIYSNPVFNKDFYSVTAQTLYGAKAKMTKSYASCIGLTK